MNTASSGSYQSYLASHSDNPYHLSHIYEFSELCKRITLETIQEVVPPMIEEICLKIVKEYLNGNLNQSINYDIHSIANVSIDHFNKIFKSEQWSRFISGAIAEEIQKRLNEISITVS